MHVAGSPSESPEETRRGDRPRDQGGDEVRLEEKGVPPLGPDAIRRQSPDTIPPRSKKSPAPLFLAASKRVRDDLRNAYDSFLAAFREAADELKAGNLDNHHDAASRSGMPEKGEALPSSPPIGGILGKCGDDGSLAPAESRPNRQIGGQSQKLTLNFAQSEASREKSGRTLSGSPGTLTNRRPGFSRSVPRPRQCRPPPPP